MHIVRRKLYTRRSFVALNAGSIFRAVPFARRLIAVRAIYPVTPYYVFTSFFPFSPPVSSHVQFIAARTRDSLCKENSSFCRGAAHKYGEPSERERERGERRRKEEKRENLEPYY